MRPMNIVVFGLSITSSWGNGHATTFRSLLKALAGRGHHITFFEQDVPWYAANRDLANPPFCHTVLYDSVADLQPYEETIGQADLVILGSYVTAAASLFRLVKGLGPTCFAFYDIDTPATLASLENGDFRYLHPQMVADFDIYFSFTGGPILSRLEQDFGAQRALPLYCSVDTDLYFPVESEIRGRSGGGPEYLLGYLGTYSDDHQPTVQEFLVEPAMALTDQRFCVAGAQYPDALHWPANVERIEHIPPARHRAFYTAQRFTLNVTRRDMIRAGFTPSVRLFEAGACGTPVISDAWEGLNTFFEPGRDILVAGTARDVREYLDISDEAREAIGRRFRGRVLSAHTSTHRAREVEQQWQRMTRPALAANE